MTKKAIIFFAQLSELFSLYFLHFLFWLDLGTYLQPPPFQRNGLRHKLIHLCIKDPTL